MKTKQILFFSLLSLLPAITMAQSVVGFWKVDMVMVGDRDVTPVAKWFKYNEDHTYQAGNGWSQNSTGTWKYDKENVEFLPYNSKGEPDEFGAFKTNFKGEKMYWERQEEGMQVVIALSPVTKMPMSPKDSITGAWELISVIKNGKNITSSYDPEHQEEMLIQWTGTYWKTNSNGSKSNGYWHMDAHNPEFHMIDLNREVDIQTFNVSFKGDQVMMRPEKDGNTTFTYTRK